MQRSINLCDLLTLKRDYPIVSMCMIQPILTQETVNHDKSRIDETAVIVDNIPDEQWDAIKSFIRNGAGQFPGIPKHLFRMYEGHKRV